MEKRAFIAVIISLIILLLYQEWVARHYGAPEPPPLEKEENIPAPLQKEPPKFQPPPSAATVAAAKVKEIRVETDDYVALFTTQGARLRSFKLKHYRASVDPKSLPFEMVSSAPGVPYPLGVRLEDTKPWDDEGVVYAVRGGDLKLAGDSVGTLTFQGRTPTGALLTKEFTFHGSGYSIGLEISVENHGSGPLLLLVTAHPEEHRAGGDAAFEGFLGLIGKTRIREHGADLAKGKEFSGSVSWAGFGYTYFLFAVLPQGETYEKVEVKQSGPALVMEVTGQSGAKTERNRYTLFIGPKELDLLKSMGQGLEQSIDFGYFGFISIPLLYLLHFSHRFTASYGLDIILLTILIKLLTAPLTHKSFASMKQMQKLQPQMERIKEKFKDDKEKLNKEIMELYRRNKVNPLGGCLPMLLQFPIFIGLYNALLTPIELRHAPFMWIKDLSRPDWESLPITVGGWTMGIPILTLLMGASMFVQQWMTPSAGDPNQRRMMYLMPIIFTAMFINFPSGLVIYWLVNNILSILQQYLINRWEG
ncbi:MAG TPA: membrane protein insertase YidC [Candidatus Binatia bacterium]|jgi:YidC/Oxa1 family membrane protein insertase|nr:membrane protein insertase YidC [Candidatus Binatia bacterium]